MCRTWRLLLINIMLYILVSIHTAVNLWFLNITSLLITGLSSYILASCNLWSLTALVFLYIGFKIEWLLLFSISVISYIFKSLVILWYVEFKINNICKKLLILLLFSSLCTLLLLRPCIFLIFIIAAWVTIILILRGWGYITLLIIILWRRWIIRFRCLT